MKKSLIALSALGLVAAAAAPLAALASDVNCSGQDCKIDQTALTTNGYIFSTNGQGAGSYVDGTLPGSKLTFKNCIVYGQGGDHKVGPASNPADVTVDGTKVASVKNDAPNFGTPHQIGDLKSGQDVKFTVTGSSNLLGGPAPDKDGYALYCQAPSQK